MDNQDEDKQNTNTNVRKQTQASFLCGNRNGTELIT